MQAQAGTKARAGAARTARPGGALGGAIRVPGDKSISHRALILGALAVGETVVRGLLEGEDVMRTAAALRALGASVERGDEGAWHIGGLGIGGLREPAATLDMGNAGTGVRLLMGVVAGHPVTCQFTGDASLCARPMGRVAVPLERMGARVVARRGCRLPLTVIGARDPMPIVYPSPVPSAQVKSAVLLAGLSAPGETAVIERTPTRDHSERLLAHFGARVRTEAMAEGGHRVAVTGQPELAAASVSVPGDPSSAAFPLVAALTVPGSRVVVEGVGINRLRAGLFEALAEMGAAIAFENLREEGGEPVADVVAAHGPLTAVSLGPERAPAMIDEYPILAVAAACAEGLSEFRGLAELRLKESDRLAAIAEGLAACGVAVEVGEDWLRIDGCAGPPPGGGRIASHLDHRIAMAFLVLGLAARRPVTVDDARPIETSFPGFVTTLRRLGGDIA